VLKAVQEWGSLIQIVPQWGDLNRFVYFHEPEYRRKARELISIQAAETLERNTFETMTRLAKPPARAGNLRRWLASKLMATALALDPNLED
jgi:hypothetical protein